MVSCVVLEGEGRVRKEADSGSDGVVARYDQPIAQGEEKSSVGFVQLEKQNERFKEALIR